MHGHHKRTMVWCLMTTPNGFTMTTSHHELDAPIHWKTPVLLIIKMTIAFSTLSFFIGYFVYHPPVNWQLPSVLLIVAYLFCLVIGIRYLIKNLPIPVLMLLVPIAPLFILLYVVSLMAFLQRFT